MNTSAHRDDAAGTLTRDVARYLALWMSYEDVIRVADMMAATRDDRTCGGRWRSIPMTAS